jgi:hypothetical protein
MYVGELLPDDLSITEPVIASDGDPYEGYPEDDLCDMQDPKVVLKATNTLCMMGHVHWKVCVTADALVKSAYHYCMIFSKKM